MSQSHRPPQFPRPQCGRNPTECDHQIREEWQRLINTPQAALHRAEQAPRNHQCRDDRQQQPRRIGASRRHKVASCKIGKGSRHPATRTGFREDQTKGAFGQTQLAMRSKSARVRFEKPSHHEPGHQEHRPSDQGRSTDAPDRNTFKLRGSRHDLTGVAG